MGRSTPGEPKRAKCTGDFVRLSRNRLSVNNLLDRVTRTHILYFLLTRLAECASFRALIAPIGGDDPLANHLVLASPPCLNPVALEGARRRGVATSDGFAGRTNMSRALRTGLLGTTLASLAILCSLLAPPAANAQAVSGTILGIVKDELAAVRQAFATPRRTEILEETAALEIIGRRRKEGGGCLGHQAAATPSRPEPIAEPRIRTVRHGQPDPAQQGAG